MNKKLLTCGILALTGLWSSLTYANSTVLEKARLIRNADPLSLELCFNQTPEYFFKTPMQGKEIAIIFPKATRRAEVSAPKVGGLLKNAKIWTAGGKSVVELFYTSTLHTYVTEKSSSKGKCLLIEATSKSRSTSPTRSERPVPPKEEPLEKTLEGGAVAPVLVPTITPKKEEKLTAETVKATGSQPLPVPAAPSQTPSVPAPAATIPISGPTPAVNASPPIAPSPIIPAAPVKEASAKPIETTPKPTPPVSTPESALKSVPSTTVPQLPPVSPPPAVAIIMIDPGHGGQDPGAIGAAGTREKNITLAIAKKLAAEINKQPGMKAYLTRVDDRFLPLRDRMAKARKEKAHIFLSIHADAARNKTADGASVYILSDKGASSEAAQWMADRENAADLVGGVVLDDKDPILASVLLDVSQDTTLEESVIAARSILYALDDVGAVHKREVQRAGFAVLKAPDVPSVLVETAFLSNPAEERKLKDTAYQQKLAEAVTQGLVNYFVKYPPSRRIRAASEGNGADPLK